MDDELMTVEQAAAVYDVSALTLRRRAQYGEIDGAVKLRGRRGQEWRIPTEAMDALGYVRRTPTSLDGAGLMSSLRALIQGLADAQRENKRLNRELTAALMKKARLAAELDAERRLADVRATPTLVDLRDKEPSLARPLPVERDARQ